MKSLEEIIPLLTPQNQRLFACDCAERALLRKREAGIEPDPRSCNAVMVARNFALGLASEEKLSATAKEALAAADSSYLAAAFSFSSYVADTAYFAAATSVVAAAASSSNSFVSTASSLSSIKKEKEWQLARAESYLEAQRTAKPSLLSVLLQRQQQLQQAIPLWVAEAEEALFL